MHMLPKAEIQGEGEARGRPSTEVPPPIELVGVMEVRQNNAHF